MSQKTVYGKSQNAFPQPLSLKGGRYRQIVQQTASIQGDRSHELPVFQKEENIPVMPGAGKPIFHRRKHPVRRHIHGPAQGEKGLGDQVLIGPVPRVLIGNGGKWVRQRLPFVNHMPGGEPGDKSPFFDKRMGAIGQVGGDQVQS